MSSNRSGVSYVARLPPIARGRGGNVLGQPQPQSPLSQTLSSLSHLRAAPNGGGSASNVGSSTKGSQQSSQQSSPHHHQSKTHKSDYSNPLPPAQRSFGSASSIVQFNSHFVAKSPFNHLRTRTSGKGLEYRMEFEHPDRDAVSPWHDLPHRVTNSTYTLLVEIPKGDRAKMEVQPKTEGNPIKQDVKNGKLRFFQFGDLPFNYGMIPQTWEDPRIEDKECGCKGDGDPLDVVEISNTAFPCGSTHEVKVLAALGLIDEGEMDWKIVAIDVHNPFADKLNSVQDIENFLPGRLAQIRHWYRFYKVAEGKGANEFAYNGEFKDVDFAVALVEKHHKQYTDLIQEGPKDTHVWTPQGQALPPLRPAPKGRS